MGTADRYYYRRMAGNVPEQMENRLILFPQWAIDDGQPQKKIKIDNIFNMEKRLEDQNDPLFAQLANIMPA